MGYKVPRGISPSDESVNRRNALYVVRHGINQTLAVLRKGVVIMALVFKPVPPEVLAKIVTRDVHYDDSDYRAAIEYALSDDDGSCAFTIDASDGEKRTKQRVTKAAKAMQIGRTVRWLPTEANLDGSLNLSFTLRTARPADAPRRTRRKRGEGKATAKELVSV